MQSIIVDGDICRGFLMWVSPGMTVLSPLAMALKPVINVIVTDNINLQFD